MGRFLSLLFLLISTVSMAGYTTSQSQLSLGGSLDPTTPPLTLNLADVASQVTIFASIDTSTAGNYQPFAKLGGATGQYQVSSGKTFYGQSICYVNSGAPTDIRIQYGYGTAALVASNTATAPTGDNPYGFEAGVAAGTGTGWLRFASSNTTKCLPISMTFPALSYPYARTLGAYILEIVITGIEK